MKRHATSMFARSPRRRSLVAIGVFALTALLAGTAYAAVGDPTFGNTTPGSTSSKPGANITFGSVYPLAEEGVTVSLNFYASGGSTDQNFLPVLYNVDAGGTPTTLVAKGDPVTVPAGAPAGWFGSPLPSQTLSSGNYLIALLSGPDTKQANVFYDPSVNGGVFATKTTYPNPKDPLTGTQSSDQLLSFYVEYQRTVQDPAPGKKKSSQSAPKPLPPPPPSRTGYCLDGSFYDLIFGQPLFDPAWAGATPAPYYEDLGLTCDSLAGYATKTVKAADGSGEGPQLVNGIGEDIPGDQSRIHPFYAKTS